MGIYIKGDFKSPYPNCDECMFGEIIQCEATTRREVYDYDVECPLSEIEVSEDAISKEWVLDKLEDYRRDYPINELDDWQNTVVNWIAMDVEDAPSVLPKPKEGKRSRCIWCDSPYRIEYNWIDREGNTASFADEDRHLVATGIANYCPNCGAKMKGKEKIKE